jgi:tRNA pseudouridine-54 N-methylase
MIKADQLAVAMIVMDDEEVFVVGHHSDIQRLDDASLVERAWEIMSITATGLTLR